jgi:hypothetical protein
LAPPRSGPSAALITSEATQVSMRGRGYAWPGIHARTRAHRLVGSIRNPSIGGTNRPPSAPRPVQLGQRGRHDYIHAVEDAEARLARLERRVEELLPAWRCWVATAGASRR